MREANGMKIKSYFAKTVDEAISKARVELGSDALLLNTRKVADAGPASGNSPGYEVVMGVAGATPAPKSASPASAPKPLPRTTVAAPAASKAPIGSAPRLEVTAEMEKLRA